MLKRLRFHSFSYTFLFIFVILLNFSLFGSISLVQNMKQGYEKAKENCGYDMVILPKEVTEVSEKILFEGLPTTFTLPKLEGIQDLKGITAYEERLYLATLKGQSCCDNEVQLIATNKYTLRKDEIILGYQFRAKKGETLTYFGRTLKVVDKLEKTGTGLDESGFISFALAEEINQDYHLYDNPVSMIFLNAKNPKATKEMIKNRYDVFVYSAEQRFLNFQKTITGIQTITILLNIIIIVLGLLAVMVIQLFSFQQRKAEIGAYHYIGYTKQEIKRLLFSEQLVVVGSGMILGIGLSALLLTLYSSLLEQYLFIPLQLSFSAILVGVMALGNLVVVKLSNDIAYAHCTTYSLPELIKLQ